MNEGQFTQLISDIAANNYHEEQLTIQYEERFDMVQRCRRIEAALQTNSHIKALHFNGYLSAPMLMQFPPFVQNADGSPRRNPITALDFSDATFMDLAATGAAVQMINANLNLEYIDVSNQAQHHLMLFHISLILAHRTNIRELALANCRFINAIIINNLVAIINLNRDLENLDLYECKIKIDDFAALMQSIASSAIQKIFCPYLPKEPDAARLYSLYLADAIRRNNSLREIYFYSLTHQTLPLLFDGIAGNQSLTTVRFEDCGFISRSKGGNVNEDSLRNFVDILNSKPNLKEFSFKADSQCTAMESDIFLRNFSTSKNLESLELSNFEFNKDNTSYCDNLAQNTSLNKISFNFCKFDSNSLMALMAALARNISITEFIFRNDKLSEDALDQCIDLVRSNPNILAIEFGGIPLSHDERVLFNDALAENQMQVYDAVNYLCRMDYGAQPPAGFFELLMPRLTAVMMVANRDGDVIAKKNLLKLASDGFALAIDPSRKINGDAGDIITKYTLDENDNNAYFQFLRTGLQFRAEQFKHEQAQLPLDDFILDKFQNGKFPRDWNILPSAELEKALIKYLQPQERLEEGRAKRRHGLNIEEKVKKLMRNGLKSHLSYEIFSGRINAEFGREILSPLNAKELATSTAQAELSELLVGAEDLPEVSGRFHADSANLLKDSQERRVRE